MEGDRLEAAALLAGMLKKIMRDIHYYWMFDSISYALEKVQRTSAVWQVNKLQ